MEQLEYLVLLLVLALIFNMLYIFKLRRDKKAAPISRVKTTQEQNTDKSLLTFLYETADKLSLISEELQNEIIKQSSLAQESSAGTEEIAAGAEELTSNIQTMDSQLWEIVSDIRKTEEDIKEVLDRTKDNQSSLNNIEEESALFAEAVKSSSLELSNLAREVQNFNQKMVSIDEMLGEVDRVAGQTNLLALNASIEAARAGSAGKGFSVVAEEVRKLSVETQNLSENIKEILRQSRDELEGITVNVKNVSEKFNVISEKSLNVSKQIKGVSEVTDKFAGIFSNTVDTLSKQFDSLNSVGNRINDISATSEEMSASIEDISRVVTHLADGINRLEEPAHVLNSSADYLYKTVREKTNLYIDEKTGRVLDDIIPRLKELTTSEFFVKLNIDEIKNKLQDLVDKIPQINLVALFNPEGVTLTDLVSNKIETEGTKGLEKKHRTWFNKVVKEGQEHYVSEPYFSSLTEQPCVTISLTIKDNDKLVGVLAVDFQYN